MSKNDPTGVFAAARREYPTAWEQARRAALPDGVTQDPGVPVVNREARNATTMAQVKRDSIQCRWGGVEFQAVPQDGQMSLTLEPGGLTPDGILTLQTTKDFFKRGKFPIDGDEVEILQPAPSNRWATWYVKAVAGQHDTTDAGLILVLQKDDIEDDQQ